MRKVLMLFFVAFAAFTLFGCNSSEYKVDGEFLAYEAQVHSTTIKVDEVSVPVKVPQVTYVTVTIENGEIAGYNIDVRQGKVTFDTTSEKFEWAWNDKTKKELGDDYNMVKFGGAISEWYVQAELIEAYWLENGVDSVTVNADNKIDNVSGVTIKDGGYIAIAQEAIELAKAGKFQSVYCSGTDLYIAEMTLSKGKIETLVLDTLQSTKNAANGESFEWKPNTKQELGDAYGMKGSGDGFKFENGAWVETKGTKATHEWFEQANTITDWIIA
ncbi:MAG: hypothetical protein EOM50_24675, partial [Erysipelotrichia bacterium]|nr:hypothetical protein [Erysipelotrichia bacterium]